jgi:hypothetical protein
MSILELKEFYNILLNKERSAEQFFDNPNILQTQKDEWLPEFVKITQCLSILMIKHKEITGVDMKNCEVLNGFKMKNAVDCIMETTDPVKLDKLQKILDYFNMFTKI